MQPHVLSRGKSIDARKNYFFASPGPLCVSNNRTKIDQRLTRGKVFLTTVKAVCWCHSEAVAEESRMCKYLDL